MKKKTSRFIILTLLLTSNLFLLSSPARAQKKDKETLKKEYKESPLYQGSWVGLEILGAGNYLLGGDFFSTEIIFQSNLKNRFLPILEVGYGKTDATNNTNNLHYKTSAPYFRIGMDYNIFYLKPYLPGFLFGGLRFGMTSFSYDVDGPTMQDPNYGGVITVPFSYTGLKSNANWLELVLGIKVKIYKRFNMGWTVRYKLRMNAKEHPNSQPWYIPGYGKNNSNSFNLMYNLIYDLPF